YALSEPADHLTERSAASLMAASRRQGAAPPVVKNVEKNSPPSVVRAAQRTLRFFGFYKGRTSGEYDDNLYAAILMFQQKKGLVGTEKDPGAGRIGPLTRGKMRDAWDRRLVTAIANRLLTLRRVEVVLDERGKNVDRFLEEGDSGDQVALLQRLLADRGFFPEEKINGNFGELTKAAVLAYQLKEELIKDAGDAGAGTVGPQTLMSLRSEQRRALYLLVRKDGWRVL
ncbi:MAG: peptidoglycan-binding protein, partial [Candidatus Peribacteraceae bacterium]|nr:peptidoglycan-binding protein [Candidatus Peribacteraceae bacterium]